MRTQNGIQQISQIERMAIACVSFAIPFEQECFAYMLNDPPTQMVVF